ncbi:MAG: FAD-dependent oxidoreductase [Patescibacteria group bacterium]
MPKKESKKNNGVFILKERIQETDDVAILKFFPQGGKNFSFRPGQFITVCFTDNRCYGQGKPYSISNCPGDEFLAIAVKEIGRFSGALHNLKIGEKVKITKPGGYFYPDEQMKNLVFLAGGIGIAPFYSIINDCFKRGVGGKNLALFYSSKTEADNVFSKELNELAEKWRGFKIIYILTRQEKDRRNGNREFQRLNAKILKKYLKNLNNKHYFICGSIEFVNDLWKELKNNKVKEDNIRVESFY